MKAIFLLIQFLLLGAASYAQNNSPIIGSWKIVSVSDGDIYFNLKTDSVFISPEMKTSYPDSLDQVKLLSNAKIIYGASQFHFGKDGVFKQTLDTMFLYSGQYVDIPSKNMIELTTSNSLGEKGTVKIPYQIKEGLLYLNFKWEDTHFDYVLEKIQ